jgi:hypothetical protein
LQIGFLLGFAILGALISTVCGFIVGNRLTYILFVSGISTLAFGGLGFGVYSILEKKVPEFLEFLGEISFGGFSFSRERSEYDESHSDGMNSEGGMTSDDLGVQSVAAADSPHDILQAQLKSGKFGDHIMVDKIAVKNEPKLMAEAIRTMLAKDDPAE